MADVLNVKISPDDWKRLLDSAELNEKQKRLFVGMLAELCDGEGLAVSRLFNVGQSTVSIGRAEFTGNKEISLLANRIRRPGGGRKSVEVHQEGLVEAVKDLLDNTSYGDSEQVLFWTTLSLRKLEDLLKAQGFNVSRTTISRIIDILGYSRQRNQKMQQVGTPHPDRDSQFCFINTLAKEYLSS